MKKKLKTGLATILSIVALYLTMLTFFNTKSTSKLNDFTQYNEVEIKHSSPAMYVPSIAIIKSAPVLNGGDCSSIPYTYAIRNVSTNGEVLVNVVITDTDLGDELNGYVIAGPDPGDFTGDIDGVLSPGEIWTFTFEYPITQNDIDAGSFGTQAANVSADVQGQGISVGDVSHPTDPNDNGPTIVDLTSCQFPDIGLIKEWEYINLDNDNCDENFLYTFRVRNTGNVSLHNVVLEDNLLGGAIPGPVASTDIGNDGILSPNEEWEYLALYSADLIQAGTIQNQATVTAETLIQGVQVSDLSDDDSFFQDDITQAPYDTVCSGSFARIGFTKVASSLDVNNDGCNDAIQYTFTLQNVGDVAVENIVLTDDLLGGEINNITNNGNGDAILDVGETWTYQDQYIITQADVSNGFVANQALVTGKIVGFDIFLFDYSDDNSFDENDVTNVQMEGFCGPPSIGLIKSVPFISGLQDLDNDDCPETIHYLFTVTNTGGIDLGQVSIMDATLNAPIIGPQNDLNNDQILSVGESWTYEAFYPLTQSDIDAGSVTNQAEVTAIELNNNSVISDFSDHTNFNEDRETVTSTAGACVAQSRIGLIKSVASGDIEDQDNDGCPETIRYVFNVENLGSIALEGVILIDPDLSAPLYGPTGDVNNDQILNVGENWSYASPEPITQQDILVGQVVNQAEVIAYEWGTLNQVSDLSDDNSYDEDDPTIIPTSGACVAVAAIDLVKSVAPGDFLDLNGDGCIETIQYSFAVSNTGTLELEQVTLVDTKINGPYNGPQNDTGNDQILSVGETWTFQALYPLTQQDVSDGQVTNQAQVSAFEWSTTNETSASDQIVTALGNNVCAAQAAISLTKYVQDTDFLDQNLDDCIETIRYNFAVSNTGTVDLEQVVLTDDNLNGEVIGPVPTSDTNNDQILSVGETWTYQALYPILQSDIDTGSVTNLAEVTAFERNTTNAVTDQHQIVTPFPASSTICPAESVIQHIKTGTLVDLDGDNCSESINYIFTITNIGTIDLGEVVLTDTYLNTPISGPEGDTGNDQILSVGESWTYEAFYTITPSDADAGSVTNQSHATAVEVTTNNPIFCDSEEVVTPVTETCFGIDPDFKIFNGISPNGDGVNDYFRINGIENYPKNTLKIFNRWGVLVFEVDGYGLGNQLFNGHSDNEATIAKDRRLPSGTYFYTLTFHGNNPGQKSYSGYLYINQD